jgi:cell division protein FtsI/penicillin-binding protein 2
MRHWATRFGFDQPIPFALPVQISRARIPSSALDRARVAAGFWQTEISALHGAVIAGVVADGGQLRWPHLVRSVTRADGRSLELERAPVQRVIGRRTSRELTRMMTRTTTEGTARKAFERRAQWPPLPDVAVAGKTGSLSRQQPYLDYSWFVGFAPADRPEVAFAALLGNPPRWRIKAAAAARALLSRYFARQQRKRALHAAASVRPAFEGH